MQQPADGELSVQTEWGQGVTQVLHQDSERKEATGEVPGCRAVLLTNTRNVSHAPPYEQLGRDRIWPWLTIATKLLSTVLANVS